MLLRTLVALLIMLPLLAEEVIAPVEKGVEVQVYFSPDGGCTDAIVRELAAAKKEVRVQAYSFTSKAIAGALRDAVARGVFVQAILDKSQRTEKYSGADFLDHAGVRVAFDMEPAIAHSKVMVIDGETVITGSFNFTMNAELRNVENLLVLRSKDLAAKYLENIRIRAAQAIPYKIAKMGSE